MVIRNNMKKRQPKEGEWIKVTNKLTNETIIGKFIRAGLDGVTLELENGDIKTFQIFSNIDIDYLYRDWDWELDDEYQEIGKVSSPDNFVKFEIREDLDAYKATLYMYIGPNKLILEEHSSTGECKDYVEKIISSIKSIE